MKTLAGLAILCAVTAASLSAAEPSPAEIVREVRVIMNAPDRWDDLVDELQTLDSLAARSQAGKKQCIDGFRNGMLEYGGYFAGHSFCLTAEERTILSEGISAYEQSFASEWARISAIWLKHPNEPHGCLSAADLALFAGESAIEQCAPAFAKHNWKEARPNELAAVYINILRHYGRLLTAVLENPEQLCPPITTGR